jgi:HAE1 family hydrophobic/amphiphilic exporter-1
MEWPTVMVSTNYSNVGPEEIDKSVTQVLLNSLMRVSDVESITSQSSNGASRIQMQFGYDKDMEEAQDDVQTVISQVTNALPDNCDSPRVFRFGINASPIMRLAITGDMSLNDLRIVAENTVQPLLERIAGVAQAEVNGGQTNNVYIKVSNNRLQAYGLTLASITSAVQARNIQISNGTMTHDSMDYEILTDE